MCGRIFLAGAAATLSLLLEDGAFQAYGDKQASRLDIIVMGFPLPGATSVSRWRNVVGESQIWLEGENFPGSTLLGELLINFPFKYLLDLPGLDGKAPF